MASYYRQILYHQATFPAVAKMSTSPPEGQQAKWDSATFPLGNLMEQQAEYRQEGNSGRRSARSMDDASHGH